MIPAQNKFKFVQFKDSLNKNIVKSASRRCSYTMWNLKHLKWKLFNAVRTWTSLFQMPILMHV